MCRRALSSHLGKEHSIWEQKWHSYHTLSKDITTLFCCACTWKITTVTLLAMFLITASTGLVWLSSTFLNLPRESSRRPAFQKKKEEDLLFLPTWEAVLKNSLEASSNPITYQLGTKQDVLRRFHSVSHGCRSSRTQRYAYRERCRQKPPGSLAFT